MFCSQCGAEVAEGAAFCSSCGAKVVAPAQPQPQPVPEPVVQPEPPVQLEPVVQSVQEPQVQPEPEQVQEPIPEVQPEPQPFAQPEPQAYGPMTPAKKSPMVPILIVAIVAALAATGVLLYFFVFRSGGAGSEVAGNYHPVAIDYNGVTMDLSAYPSNSVDMQIELREDGTGSFSHNSEKAEIRWELDGTNLKLKLLTGQEMMSSVGGNVEYKNGRIYFHMNASGMSVATILAKEGDDLSDLNMSDFSDLIKQFN